LFNEGPPQVFAGGLFYFHSMQLPPEFYQLKQRKMYRAALDAARPEINHLLYQKGQPTGQNGMQAAQNFVNYFDSDTGADTDGATFEDWVNAASDIIGAFGEASTEETPQNPTVKSNGGGFTTANFGQMGNQNLIYIALAVLAVVIIYAINKK
jgi:hypothetical protein